MAAAGSRNLPEMQTSATNKPAGKSARQRHNRKQTVNTRSRSESDLRHELNHAAITNQKLNKDEPAIVEGQSSVDSVSSPTPCGDTGILGQR
jgi:hypothetical protein